MVSTRRRTREGDSDDPAFLALPPGFRRQIDEVFDTSASRKSRRTPHNGDDIPAGGFVIDDAECGGSSIDDEGPGGFLVPNDIDGDADSYVALSSIPNALCLLGLEADDEVLAVFRNAATGWGVRSEDAQGVCRKDWRAVCAVLLGDQEGMEAETPGKENIEIDEDSGSEGDEYEMSELSNESEEESSEEFKDNGQFHKSRTATTTPRKAPSKISTSSMIRSIHLTEAQKAICRADFARFFPASTDAQLEHQRIMAHEIMHASDLLKEKLKPDEVSIPTSMVS